MIADEMSQEEIAERFENLRENFNLKKYQMADLLGIGESAYQRKTNNYESTSFRKTDLRLLYFLEKYGMPEGYEPPERQPTYDRTLQRQS